MQIRGSIPLYWVQDTASVSPINPKPAIQLQQYDPHYSATRLHFQVGPVPLTVNCMHANLPPSVFTPTSTYTGMLVPAGAMVGHVKATCFLHIAVWC